MSSDSKKQKGNGAFSVGSSTLLDLPQIEPDKYYLGMDKNGGGFIKIGKHIYEPEKIKELKEITKTQFYQMLARIYSGQI